MLIDLLNDPHLNLEEMTEKAYSGGIEGIKINGEYNGKVGWKIKK